MGDQLNFTGNAGAASGNPLYDWNYRSVPQTNAGGASVLLPRGKVIGGSSAINLLGWDRGTQSEYDTWSQFFQSGGWSFAKLLPYFKKSENFDQHTNIIPGTSPRAFNPVYNGNCGPVNVYDSLRTVDHGEVLIEYAGDFVPAANGRCESLCSSMECAGCALTFKSSQSTFFVSVTW